MTILELTHIAEYYFRKKRTRCRFDRIVARDKLKVKGERIYIFVGVFDCPNGSKRTHLVKLNKYGKKY
ncbi:hypothetical protein [Salipaludibacillus aurantiacus]|uniref:hypothetical protein n=1 Tax=Salipaludibacillus aurantiacus TaxID=1601833 RepID=UPI0015A65650|nr:hypothetical protein [Salipaludibacillus aurantiacus]